MAPKKNNFWQLRTRHGRDKIFENAANLREAAFEYFQAATDNPLEEEKAFSTGVAVTLNRLRPFTQKAMFVYLGISRKTWENYSKEPAFEDVVEEIENIIYTQKFEGAAAGLFNANLISREIGLSEKISFNPEDLTDDQLDRLLRKCAPNLNLQ